jgi:two-component system CheB/CheR fusion protein
MQSLNEELQTVNAELQSKVDDFTRVNNDMKNLLNSTDIATLFLDKELNIRRFTLPTTKIFKLIKSDIGRHFTDLASDLIYPELADDALEVLNTLVFIQKQIPTLDGRWYLIRIMPYRTFDDRIDGLVITFINISDHKRVEDNLTETEQLNRLLINLSADVIIRLSPDWKIVEFNPGAEMIFGKKREEVLDQNYLQMLVPAERHTMIETELGKFAETLQDGNFKMQMITRTGVTEEIEWSVFNHHDFLKKSNGMTLITKITKP